MAARTAWQPAAAASGVELAGVRARPEVLRNRNDGAARRVAQNQRIANAAAHPARRLLDDARYRQAFLDAPLGETREQHLDFGGRSAPDRRDPESGCERVLVVFGFGQHGGKGSLVPREASRGAIIYEFWRGPPPLETGRRPAVRT